MNLQEARAAYRAAWDAVHADPAVIAAVAVVTAAEAAVQEAEAAIKAASEAYLSSGGERELEVYKAMYRAGKIAEGRRRMAWAAQAEASAASPARGAVRAAGVVVERAEEEDRQVREANPTPEEMTREVKNQRYSMLKRAEYEVDYTE